MAKNNDMVMVNAAYGDWNISISVPESVSKGVEYFLSYGVRQSLQDSIAGMEKELKNAVNDEGFRKYNANEIAIRLRDTMAERFTRAMAGDIHSGSHGPRVVGVEKHIRDVTTEWLRNAVAKTGKALPKDKAAYNTLFSRYGEKNAEAIRAEAERRMNAGKAETVDLDDLMA